MDINDFGLAPIKTTGIEDEDLKNRIIEALMQVIDPELNMDIVNLGLIYELIMDEDKNLNLKMTLTAMGCPLAGSMSAQAQAVLIQIPEVNNAVVDIVWTPPWDRKRVSKVAGIQLGLR